jgi:hypothetical protein
MIYYQISKLYNSILIFSRFSIIPCWNEIFFKKMSEQKNFCNTISFLTLFHRSYIFFIKYAACHFILFNFQLFKSQSTCSFNKIDEKKNLRWIDYRSFQNILLQDDFVFGHQCLWQTVVAILSFRIVYCVTFQKLLFILEATYLPNTPCIHFSHL